MKKPWNGVMLAVLLLAVAPIETVCAQGSAGAQTAPVDANNEQGAATKAANAQGEGGAQETAPRNPASRDAGSDPVDPSALDSDSIYQTESVWTNADGKQMPMKALRGKVRVMAIFYSTCEYACPIIVGKMKSVQAELPEKIRDQAGFLLVSMDSGKDDPAQLREYAKRMELEGDWTLLRGADGDVRELAALIGFRYRQEADGEFAHSNMITVLDQEGRVAFQSQGLDSDVKDAVRSVTGLVTKDADKGKMP